MLKFLLFQTIWLFWPLCCSLFSPKLETDCSCDIIQLDPNKQNWGQNNWSKYGYLKASAVKNSDGRDQVWAGESWEGDLSIFDAFYSEDSKRKTGSAKTWSKISNHAADEVH